MTIEEYIDVVKKGSNCKCEINNGKIDVKGDVTLLFQDEIPYKFGVVQGDFSFWAFQSGTEVRGMNNLPDKVKTLSLSGCSSFPNEIEAEGVSLEDHRGEVKLKKIDLLSVNKSNIKLSSPFIKNLYISNTDITLDVKEVQELHLRDLNENQIKLQELPKISKIIEIESTYLDQDFPLDKINSRVKVIVKSSKLKSYLGLLGAGKYYVQNDINYIVKEYNSMKKVHKNLTPMKYERILRLRK